MAAGLTVPKGGLQPFQHAQLEHGLHVARAESGVDEDEAITLGLDEQTVRDPVRAPRVPARERRARAKRRHSEYSGFNERKLLGDAVVEQRRADLMPHVRRVMQLNRVGGHELRELDRRDGRAGGVGEAAAL